MMPNTTRSADNQATVIQTAPTKLPMLTAEDITIETIVYWRRALNSYFLHSETKEEMKTIKTATTLLDPKIQSWYGEAEIEFNALPFETFIKEVCTTVLSAGWKTKQYHKMLCLHQES